ncbi:MAG TPA: 4Fe-4S double cluster binding domain-containing protein [Candidatus Deferrimicrobium sp.]|nr:4Fe-4S double cluster binding domain-containing protein [Candidatus Deferrimicrobium sp.]
MTTVTVNIEDLPYPHRIVSARRREDLKKEIDSLHADGKLADLIYRSYSRIFDCPMPKGYSESGSLIVAAVPRPQETVGFSWKGTIHRLLLPPSYIRYWEITEQVESLLNQQLNPHGYSVTFARVPQKIAATRSGLAQYGRNNIAYVPGCGSLHMLVTFYSDMPCSNDTWQEPEIMQRCQTCSACAKSCPSNAISHEGFMIQQDRCITLYSGYSGSLDFPGWLEPSWIECLIGCMKCQRICPENRDYVNWIEENETFSEEETQLLRVGLNENNIPEPVKDKLARMGLIRFFGLQNCLEVFSRKLKLLLS